MKLWRELLCSTLLISVARGRLLRQPLAPKQAPAPILGKKSPIVPASAYRQVLHNYENVQYYADFKIGGQNIAGIFDTGSFELLVRSTRCSMCVHPTPPYDHTKSASYVENGTTIKHVFGSGPCISYMGYDEVDVGPMKAKDQAFWEIIEHQIQVLDKAKFAAIVGIGPNFAYGNTEQTLLMSLGVDEFSVCLQKPVGSNGFLTWGPEQTNLQKSDYATAEVIGKHHWAAKMENVTFLKSATEAHLASMPCGNGQPCVAIVDSGTSLIAAPAAALMALSEQIEPIADDCSNLDSLPTLRFHVGGQLLELPPQAYVMRIKGATLEADSVWDILFFKPKVRKIDMCMPAFMQLDMTSQHGPVWILGMPFFRYYHTTFDRQAKELRFAPSGPNCMPTPYSATNFAVLEDDDETALLTVGKKRKRLSRSPMDVNIGELVPPRLSGLIDLANGALMEI